MRPLPGWPLWAPLLRVAGYWKNRHRFLDRFAAPSLESSPATICTLRERSAIAKIYSTYFSLESVTLELRSQAQRPSTRKARWRDIAHLARSAARRLQRAKEVQ